MEFFFLLELGLLLQFRLFDFLLLLLQRLLLRLLGFLAGCLGLLGRLDDAQRGQGFDIQLALGVDALVLLILAQGVFGLLAPNAVALADLIAFLLQMLLHIAQEILRNGLLGLLLLLLLLLHLGLLARLGLLRLALLLHSGGKSGTGQKGTEQGGRKNGFHERFSLLWVVKVMDRDAGRLRRRHPMNGGPYGNVAAPSAIAFAALPLRDGTIGAQHCCRCMEFRGDHPILAHRPRVWRALQDSEILRECLPGCEDMAHISPHELAARIRVTLGDHPTLMATRLVFSDRDAYTTLTISARAQAGAAGFVKGSAAISLADRPDQATILSYRAKANPGGGLAQLDEKAFASAIDGLINGFFDTFAKRMAEPGVVPPGERVETFPPGASTTVIVSGLIAFAVVVWLVYFTGGS